MFNELSNTKLQLKSDNTINEWVAIQSAKGTICRYLLLATDP